MTRRDWWLGVALIVLVIVGAFIVQTSVLLRQIQAAQTPAVRPLVAASLF